MSRKILALLLCLVLLTGCTPAMQDVPGENQYVFTDDTGAQIEVSYQPQKVAVLTSSLADLWTTAGGKADITVYETVERGFAESGVILVDDGAGKTVNLELLIASKPDFVLYSAELSGQRECAEYLKSFSIPAAGFAVETFEDYLRLLKICTRILQTPENYTEYGEKVETRVNELISLANAQKNQPDILFVRAGSSAKYTKAKTAENHFTCVMLKEMGTCNIAESAPVLLDGLSMEAILLADPDVIMFTTMGDESAGTAYMESLLTDPVWQLLSAVKEEKVHQLPKELFQYKPNARWDAAYAYLIRLLYGDIL